MQEEVTQKIIALSMKTGKLTTQALQAALKKYLQHRVKGPKLQLSQRGARSQQPIHLGRGEHWQVFLVGEKVINICSAVYTGNTSHR